MQAAHGLGLSSYLFTFEADLELEAADLGSQVAESAGLDDPLADPTPDDENCRQQGPADLRAVVEDRVADTPPFLEADFMQQEPRLPGVGVTKAGAVVDSSFGVF